MLHPVLNIVQIEQAANFLLEYWLNNILEDQIEDLGNKFRQNHKDSREKSFKQCLILRIFDINLKTFFKFMTAFQN